MRISAQIYNEEADYVALANAVLELQQEAKAKQAAEAEASSQSST